MLDDHRQRSVKGVEADGVAIKIKHDYVGLDNEGLEVCISVRPRTKQRLCFETCEDSEERVNQRRRTFDQTTSR